MEYPTPVLIRNDSKIEMERILLQGKKEKSKDTKFDEDWLRNMVLTHPAMLPTKDIEDIYANIIPIGKEISTNVGPIDALFITPDGFLVVVETKLWRNPEAKREVVMQTIDYGKELTKWSFTQLDTAVKKYSGKNTIELISNKKRINETETASLIDKITRNLKSGNMLLLIVGDGIKESVVDLVEYFQKFPTMQFTLGLVELLIYRGKNDKEILIVPKVIERTREIPRAVVTIEDGKFIDIGLPKEKTTAVKTVRTTIQEDKLLEMLDKVSPGYSEIAKKLIGEAETFGLQSVLKQGSIVLKLKDPSLEIPLTFFGIDKRGTFATADFIIGQLKRIGFSPDLAEDYTNVVKSIFTNAKPSWYDKKEKKDLGIKLILNEFKNEDKYRLFINALNDFINKIKGAIAARS